MHRRRAVSEDDMWPTVCGIWVEHGDVTIGRQKFIDRTEGECCERCVKVAQRVLIARAGRSQHRGLRNRPVTAQDLIEAYEDGLVDVRTADEMMSRMRE